MMVDQQAQARTITMTEIDGRITELENQRNEALKRCAILAGEKALAHDILRQARAEIDRLNALVAPEAPPAGTTPN